MKATELRIGNLIQDIALDKWFSVTSQLIFDYDRLQMQNHVKPIPLTEEWLVKFGFGYWVDEDEWYSPDKDATMRINNYTKGDKIGIFEDIFDIEIKHVHQLQNLYFALTGEELTPDGAARIQTL